MNLGYIINMSSLVWVLECTKHDIYERGIKKSEINRLYTKHVREGCLQVKDVYCLELDERFRI